MSFAPSNTGYGKKSGAKLRQMARNSNNLPLPIDKSLYPMNELENSSLNTNQISFSGNMDSLVSPIGHGATFSRRGSLLYQNSRYIQDAEDLISDQDKTVRPTTPFNQGSLDSQEPTPSSSLSRITRAKSATKASHYAQQPDTVIDLEPSSPIVGSKKSKPNTRTTKKSQSIDLNDSFDYSIFDFPDRSAGPAQSPLSSFVKHKLTPRAKSRVSNATRSINSPSESTNMSNSIIPSVSAGQKASERRAKASRVIDLSLTNSKEVTKRRLEKKKSAANSIKTSPAVAKTRQGARNISSITQKKPINRNSKVLDQVGNEKEDLANSSSDVPYFLTSRNVSDSVDNKLDFFQSRKTADKKGNFSPQVPSAEPDQKVDSMETSLINTPAPRDKTPSKVLNESTNSVDLISHLSVSNSNKSPTPPKSTSLNSKFKINEETSLNTGNQTPNNRTFVSKKSLSDKPITRPSLKRIPESENVTTPSIATRNLRQKTIPKDNSSSSRIADEPFTLKRKRSLPRSSTHVPIQQAKFNNYFGIAPKENKTTSTTERAATTDSQPIKTDQDDDVWSFLGGRSKLPDIKRKRTLCFNSTNFNSDSESEGERNESKGDGEADADADTQLLYSDFEESQQSEVTAKSSSVPTYFSRSITRPTYSTVRKYGSERSYLAEEGNLEITGEPNDLDSVSSKKDYSFLLNFDVGNPESDSSSSDVSENEEEKQPSSGFIPQFRAAHDLRNTGNNITFNQEIHDLLEGLNQDASRRSSLLDLCERCLSKDFVQDLRLSPVTRDLFEDVCKETDPICTFLAGFLMCALLSDMDRHAGLASALISYGAIDMLMPMINDTQNVVRIVKQRGFGESKIFIKTFLDALKKFQIAYFPESSNPSDSSRPKSAEHQDTDGDEAGKYEGLIFSRSLISLTALSSLQNQDEKVDMLFCEKMAEKQFILQLINAGQSFQSDLLPFSQHKEWKYHAGTPDNEPDDFEGQEMFQEYLSKLHLLNTVCSQLEHLLQNRFEETLEALESHSNLLPLENHFLVSSLQFFAHLVENHWMKSEDFLEPGQFTNLEHQYNLKVLRYLKLFLVKYLKVMILLTSNVAYEDMVRDPFTQKSKFITEVYKPDQARKVLELLYILNVSRCNRQRILATEDVNNDKPKDKEHGISSEPDINTHNDSDSFDENIELFSWGLLVNICESPAIVTFLFNKCLPKLQHFLNQIHLDKGGKYNSNMDGILERGETLVETEQVNDTSELTKKSSIADSLSPPNNFNLIMNELPDSHLLHIWGYQLLVAGLLLANVKYQTGDNDNHSANRNLIGESKQKSIAKPAAMFTPVEEAKIKRGLREFRKSLSNNKWGLGLMVQIERVLKTID